MFVSQKEQSVKVKIMKKVYVDANIWHNWVRVKENCIIIREVTREEMSDLSLLLSELIIKYP